MISSINIIIELSCLVSALYYLRKDQGRFSRVTIFYLTFVCFSEIAGFTIGTILQKPNAWIYNIFIIFEAMYISYGLYVALKGLSIKANLISVTTITIFFLIYIVECINQSFYIFNSKSILFASIIFALSSLYYYFLLIKDKEPINLKYNAMYWWVTGVFVYYFGSTVPNLLLSKYIKAEIVFTFITLFLNLLLYSFWIYSFICNSRQRK